MKYRAAGNLVVSSGFLVVHLLPREDESLLWGWDALLLFHTLLDSLDLVSGFDVYLYFLPREGFHLDQHPD